ncbi:MAG: NfeD family protein [Spirochaetales bacterium]|nr:NfeD family protein [Spirochaetales bacterium]
MSLLITIGLGIIGIIAIIIEFFVPAAGIIGIIGGGSIIGGIVLTYIHFGKTAGSLYLLGALVFAPALIILYFRFFHRSWIGKKLILDRNQSRNEGFASYEEQRYDGLLGVEGTALTDLRPSGMAKIDDKKYSVLTGGEYIEAGVSIRVTRIDGSRIVVQKL